MLGIRSKGKTLQAIADALNAEGHTTRTGIAWNPTQVLSKALKPTGSSRSRFCYCAAGLVVVSVSTTTRKIGTPPSQSVPFSPTAPWMFGRM